ncbi:metal-sensitive transcriptional regulator [Pontibacter sp. 172403-2]|uniref:metal-sensing transcriptional repressor n=1 Tax=Pontibacter rufus TaxID=2791028 RepID=UPI0018AFD241|nr:metal-sensing transcriptional repressor [Pontibacter sp. 172403-2]MBF9252155.1 metal-sensitive transcriptional regulator [Pontibacter sp. 172403-2]
MLQKDLVRDVKTRLNTIKGQLDGIIKMIDNDRDPEQILLQFKATGKALENAELLLLDEAFRKSLAVKLSETMEACPGDCGQEHTIERLRNQFPHLGLGELTEKMKEIQAVYEQMKKNQEKG